MTQTSTDLIAVSKREATGKARRRKSFCRNPYIWAAGIACGILTATRPLLRHVPDAPGTQSVIPPFQLKTQLGRLFDKHALSDKVQIMSLIATRDQHVTPQVMQAMGTLQDRLEQHRSPIKLLSLTIDPVHDTPSRLRRFASAHGANRGRWTFLTGDPAQIQNLLRDGFSVIPDAMLDNLPNAITTRPRDCYEASVCSGPNCSGPDSQHTTRGNIGQLFIVDGLGGVRGRYAIDALGVDEVFHRSQHVLREQRRKRKTHTHMIGQLLDLINPRLDRGAHLSPLDQ